MLQVNAAQVAGYGGAAKAAGLSYLSSLHDESDTTSNEVVTLRRRLQQADNEVTALKPSLAGSIASAAAASSESSGSYSSAALKLVIDVLNREI